MLADHTGVARVSGMNSVLLLLLLCQSRAVIYCDDGPHSRILVAELQRDWLAPSASVTLTREAVSRLGGFRCRQARVMGRCSIVRTDIAAVRPAISFSEYGEPVSIDARAFCASGMALWAVDVMLENADTDLSGWRCECLRRMRQARREHILRTAGWLHSRHRDLWETLVLKGLSFGDAGLVGWTDYLDGEYDSLDGYTRFVIPEMPKSPLKPLPWETR